MPRIPSRPDSPRALFCVMVLALFAVPAFCQQPELYLQTPHSKWINSAAASEDGAWYATASADRTIRIWSASTGLLENILQGHQDDVVEVSFSPDVRQIASVSYDGTIRIWNSTTGAQLRSLKSEAKLFAVAWSPDGRYLASEGSTKVDIWNTADWTLHSSFTPPTEFIHTAFEGERLSFSSDGNQLFVATISGVVVVSTDTGNPRAGNVILPGQKIVSDRTGRTLATSDGQILTVIDPVSLKSVRSVRTGLQNRPFGMALSPDGSLIAVYSGNSIGVWEVASGNKLFQWNFEARVPPGIQPFAAAFSADSHALLVADNQGRLRDYELFQGTVVWQTDVARTANLVAYASDGTLAVQSAAQTIFLQPDGHISSRDLLYKEAGFEDLTMYSFAMSPDQKVLSTGGGVGNAFLWDTSDGLLLHDTSAGHQALLNDVEFSADGKTLATAGCDTRVLIFAAIDGKLQQTLTDTDCADRVLFTPDGSQVIVGYGGGSNYKEVSLDDTATKRNTEVEIWDIRSGQRVRSLEGHEEKIVALALSPNGQWIASADASGKLILWARNSGEKVGEWSIDAKALAFSADGSLLGVAGSSQVKFISVPQGRLETLTIPLDYPARSLSFAPTNGRLAIAEGPEAKIWDVRTGKLVATVIPSGTDSYFLATPTGHYLARGQSQLASFRWQGRVFSYDQFDLRFNRPDQVLQEIGATDQDLIRTYHTAYLYRLQRAGLNEGSAGEADLGTLPEMRVLRSEQVQNTLKLQLSASASQATLTRLLITVNGVPLSNVPEANIPSGSRTYNQAVSIPLSIGANTIQASILDSQLEESLRTTLTVFNPAPPRKPTLHLLAVGVSKYSQGQFNLKYADEDAKALAAYFGQQHGQYSQVDSKVLLNSDATHDAVLNTLRGLTTAGVDDTVILFFSGHGLLDKDLNYYFAASDIDFANPKINGISYAELNQVLSAIPARNKLLLMDSCHSGEVDQVPSLPVTSPRSGNVQAHPVEIAAGAKGFPENSADVLSFNDASELTEEMFADLRHGSGAITVAASEGSQLSYESERWHDHGVFTFALLEGLAAGAADENNDGYITIAELGRYVNDTVQEMTGGAQHPSFPTMNPWNDFRLGLPQSLEASYSDTASSVLAVSLAPNGEWAVWSDVTGSYHVRNLKTGVALPSIASAPGPSGSAFTSNQNWIGWYGQGVFAFDIEQKKITSAKPFPGTPRLLLSNPAANPATGLVVGHALLGMSTDDSVLVDTVGAKVVKSWRSGSVQAIWVYGFSPDGSLIAEGARAKPGAQAVPIQVLSGRSGEPVQKLEDAQSVGSLAFSPDNKLIAVGTTTNQALVYDVSTGKQLFVLGQKTEKAWLTCLTFSRDGDTLIAGSSDGQVYFWRLDPQHPEAMTIQNRDAVTSLAINDSSHMLLVGGSHGFVRVWDISAQLPAN